MLGSIRIKKMVPKSIVNPFSNTPQIRCKYSIAMHDKYTANTYQIQKIPINTRKNTRKYIIFQFVSKNTNYYDFWFRVKESGKSEGSSVINPPGFGLGELLCLGCGVDGT